MTGGGDKDQPRSAQEPMARERLTAFVRRLLHVSGPFDKDYVEEFSKALYDECASAYQSLSYGSAEELLEDVRSLVARAKGLAPETRTVVKNLAALVDGDLAGAARLDPSGEDQTIVQHAGIRQAIERIEKHYDEDIRIDDLAKTACMSRSHFISVFKRETGYTPPRAASECPHRGREAPALRRKKRDGNRVCRRLFVARRLRRGIHEYRRSEAYRISEELGVGRIGFPSEYCQGALDRFVITMYSLCIHYSKGD